MRVLLAFLLVAVLSVSASAAPNETAVIQIKSRPAASMLAAVRPIVGTGGSVSAFHDKLIVSASKAKISAVRKMLAEIDKPARRLIIEVRQAGSVSAATRSLDYGINTGNLRLGRAPSGSKGGLEYRDAQTRARGDSLQRVQALDGRPAFIRAGESVPTYNAHQQIIGNQVVQGFEMQYRDTGSGFRALPRVHGDQVTVEIYQQHERPMNNGRFAVQQASTVLRGGLGQWLTLGSTGDNSGDRDDRWGRHTTTRRSQDQRLELRVLAVD